MLLNHVLGVATFLYIEVPGLQHRQEVWSAIGCLVLSILEDGAYLSSRLPTVLALATTLGTSIDPTVGTAFEVPC